jgi:hypothetical protein
MQNSKCKHNLVTDNEVKRAAEFTARRPQVTVCILHFGF